MHSSLPCVAILAALAWVVGKGHLFKQSMMRRVAQRNFRWGLFTCILSINGGFVLYLDRTSFDGVCFLICNALALVKWKGEGSGPFQGCTYVHSFPPSNMLCFFPPSLLLRCFPSSHSFPLPCKFELSIGCCGSTSFRTYLVSMVDKFHFLGRISFSSKCIEENLDGWICFGSS